MQLRINVGDGERIFKAHFHYSSAMLVSRRHPDGIDVPTTYCHVHTGECRRDGANKECETPGFQGISQMSPSEPGFPTQTTEGKYAARKHAFERAIEEYPKVVRAELWNNYLLQCPAPATRKSIRHALKMVKRAFSKGLLKGTLVLADHAPVPSLDATTNTLSCAVCGVPLDDGKHMRLGGVA